MKTLAQIAVVLAAVMFITACAQSPNRDLQKARPPLAEDVERAYARMQKPYVLGGEDVTSLYYAFADHLRLRGDAEFALSLSQFSGERIAAVRHFIEKRTLEQYPRTRDILAAAPRLQFPAAKITEEDARRP